MQPSVDYVYNATVTKVYDGDTLGCVVDLGFSAAIGNPKKPMVFRLSGIDAFETTLRDHTTPEQKQRGLEAKLWLTERVLGKQIVLHSKGEDAKFGRYLAEVWYEGESINEKMRTLGFTKS